MLVLEKYEKEMFVGNIFLMLTDLVIDYATKTVHQHGLFGLTEERKNNSHKLVSCDNVRVPPWHVAWVKSEVSLPRNFVMSLERDFLIEPNVRLAEQKFLHGSNALVRTHDNVCYVSVANFSNISQTIPVGYTLADVVPIDIVEVTSHPDSTHQKIEQQLSQLKTGDLSGDQKQRLLSLLRKYPTCFPTCGLLAKFPKWNIQLIQVVFYRYHNMHTGGHGLKDYYYKKK